MSDIARSILVAFCEETARIRSVAQALGEGAIPALLGDVDVALPLLAGRVDVENLAIDPQGLGDLATWSVVGGTRRTDSDVPSAELYSRSVVATRNAATGTLTLRCRVRTLRSGPHWWYLALSTTARGNRRGRIVTSTPTTLGETVYPTARSLDGWTICGGGPVTLTAGTDYWIEATSDAAKLGEEIFMTGATLCYGKNPGGPFHAGMPTEDQYAYDWTGAANGSRSRRHTRMLDMYAIHEQAAGFPVAPEGASDLGRRNYLLARRQARRKAWGSKLVDLIVTVIRSEDPSFSADSVRIVEDIPNYEYHVELAYAEEGPLAVRIDQLIDDVAPIHLKRTTTVWGTFRASISLAGDPV